MENQNLIKQTRQQTLRDVKFYANPFLLCSSFFCVWCLMFLFIPYNHSHEQEKRPLQKKSETFLVLVGVAFLCGLSAHERVLAKVINTLQKDKSDPAGSKENIFNHASINGVMR